MQISCFLIKQGRVEGGVEYCIGGRRGMQVEKEKGFSSLIYAISLSVTFLWNSTVGVYLYLTCTHPTIYSCNHASMLYFFHILNQCLNVS